MAAEKVSLYNLADLKNTADDAIPNYLNSLKFKQTHFLSDVRLALGYSAFLVSAACFAWDYKLGFESTKTYTAIAVAVYTLLNGLLTFWMMFVEKGVVYQGVAPSGDKITVATSTKKLDPTYRLSITVTDTSAKSRIIEIAKPFASFFDESGYFVAAPFQQILATAVPIVGKLDPKRIKSESQDMLNASPEILDAILAANNAAAASTGAEAVEGGKRRKA
ncbi:microsomal signal peptidase 25 kDa subunit domain-containing protein [Trichoderma longibrachiatum]|uniref:Signal peptidase complex subunit 2 n=1 Tax=Trichoderma longibrachiatum ATCC 18648 TaxID=983965 RepID=A0A2T4BTZ2_TRILO|nr:SPC25-domain-containing protein [Trichoderma longibrachiatum ATCC 18648]